MKATLVLILSLCLVLVDVSFGDDNGNTDTAVTPRTGDARSSQKCERILPKLTNVFCVYKCRSIDLTFEKEPDGTPCKYFGFKGRCRDGACITGRSSMFAP
ncbi:hypothetical protein ISCGN_009759 [Ixodes scapularis]